MRPGAASLLPPRVSSCLSGARSGVGVGSHERHFLKLEVVAASGVQIWVPHGEGYREPSGSLGRGAGARAQGAGRRLELSARLRPRRACGRVHSSRAAGRGEGVPLGGHRGPEPSPQSRGRGQSAAADPCPQREAGSPQTWPGRGGMGGIRPAVGSPRSQSGAWRAQLPLGPVARLPEIRHTDTPAGALAVTGQVTLRT